jgi:hypothetical protein
MVVDVVVDVALLLLLLLGCDGEGLWSCRGGGDTVWCGAWWLMMAVRRRCHVDV